MKIKREAKESFTVATLIILNLSCFFFSYIVTATDLLTRFSNLVILVIGSLIVVPFLYKFVIWVSKGRGNKVLRVPIFYTIFILCSVIEIYIISAFLS